MKLKRLLSLMLVFVMLAAMAVLSGCTSEEDVEGNEETSKEVVALNMYIITDDETDPVEANKVQMMINRELLPVEKTLLKINYIKESEYWDIVEKKLEDTRENDSGNVFVKGLKGKTFNQIVDFIFDDKTTDFELDGEQIDIFIVNDYDKYVDLAKEGYMSAFSLGSLDQMIYPTFITSATVNGILYGVPTNTMLEEGEFTYFVVNKTLLDKYGFKPKDAMVVSSKPFKDFLKAVKDGEPGVWPMSSGVNLQGAEIYEDAFITVGSLSTVGSNCNAAYKESMYTEHLLAIDEFKKSGYIPAEGTNLDGANFAIKVEKSTEFITADEERQWTDENGNEYIRLLYDIPRASAKDLFKSAMCVSSTSPNTERAMEIVTLFQSDAELANLLQYGIEGEHYTYDAAKGFTSKGVGYSMNNLYTGNTFIKYNEDPDYIAKSIERNHTKAPSSLLGFDPEFESGSKTAEYECVKALLQKATERINAGDDLNEVISLVGYELEVMGHGYNVTSWYFR